MVESLHYLIDQLTGILLPLLGKVEIDHGGFELGMAHVSLDDPTEGDRAYGMDSHENFRKVYKSRNLPRSGLLEQRHAADGASRRR
jgi:hypothetical protein